MSKTRPVRMSGHCPELSHPDPRLTVYDSRSLVPLLMLNFSVRLRIAHCRLRTLTTVHSAGMYFYVLLLLRNYVPDPSYRFGNSGTLTFTLAG